MNRYIVIGLLLSLVPSFVLMATPSRRMNKYKASVHRGHEHVHTEHESEKVEEEEKEDDEDDTE